MPVTFTTNYKEVLAAQTVEKIAELCDDNQYSLEDALKFIDEYSEEEFCDHYDEYVELGEEYGYDAVDAFLKECGNPYDLKCFESAYIGEYHHPREMAEEYFDGDGDVERLDYRIVIDWQETADYLLTHDVDRVEDFYFRCNW